MGHSLGSRYNALLLHEDTLDLWDPVLMCAGDKQKERKKKDIKERKSEQSKMFL